MINIRELKNDHSGEVFLALGYSEKINRQVLIACMPKVWEWQEDASKELKKIVKEHYSRDQEFFRELLTNKENDCSPLLLADPSVYTDEEILFLAMEADENFGRMGNAFSIFATDEQKKNEILLKRILEKFPNAINF